MRQFIKFIFASCLGIVLFFVAVLGFAAIAGLASGGEKKVTIKPNSILELRFDEQIPELTNNVHRDPFDFDENDVVGLQDMLKSIEQAKTDKNIKGILIYPKGGVGGLASLEAVRNKLKEFKDEGKFIVSYATNYSQGNYYLASTADKVYMHPMGSVDFRGLAVTVPFFKTMLENIGVKFDVFYAGNFKSATEPFRRMDISEPNRVQLRAFLNEVYDNLLENVSDARDIPVEKLDGVVQNFELKNAELAQEYGFVDALVYRDEVFEDLKDRLGLEQDEKIRTVSVQKYFSKVKGNSKFSANDKVAVIYAEGSIVDGEGEPGETGDAKYVPIIEKLRKDDKVKAIVLRVNSGGGSALSSENMWRELKLTQEAGKKIVVSMGDYAASGGYYIACAADSIFAEPQTITGSIGVFSMFPNTQGLMNDKLGIAYDTVATGPYAAGFNPNLGLSEEEGAYLQRGVDELYERFLKRVGDARGMNRDEVHEIAQGRIWTGRRAVQNGLVDRLGDLDDAVASVVGLAGLENYKVVNYPKMKDPIKKLIEDITGQGDDENPIVDAFASELKAFGINYDDIQMLKKARTPQYLMPFKVKFE